MNNSIIKKKYNFRIFNTPSGIVDSENDEAKYLAYLIDLYLYDGFGPEGYIFGANSQRRSPSEHPERFYAEIFEDSP